MRKNRAFLDDPLPKKENLAVHTLKALTTARKINTCPEVCVIGQTVILNGTVDLYWDLAFGETPDLPLNRENECENYFAFLHRNTKRHSLSHPLKIYAPGYVAPEYCVKYNLGNG